MTTKGKLSQGSQKRTSGSKPRRGTFQKSNPFGSGRAMATLIWNPKKALAGRAGGN